MAAFCSAGLSVFGSCLVEVEKLDGDGAAEVNESEQPAKMSTGKARISNDARFDSSHSMGPANLSLVWSTAIGIARPLLYCIAQ